MGSLSTVLLPETLRSIDSATFTGSYQAVGTQLTHPVRIVKFTNLSTINCTISWDGLVDAEILPANGFVLLDITGARELSGIMDIQIGTQFYVKGSAGVGLVYISCYYGR